MNIPTVGLVASAVRDVNSQQYRSTFRSRARCTGALQSEIGVPGVHDMQLGNLGSGAPRRKTSSPSMFTTRSYGASSWRSCNGMVSPWIPRPELHSPNCQGRWWCQPGFVGICGGAKDRWLIKSYEVTWGLTEDCHR